MDKEFLYVGHYIDTNGNYILKVGTTNDVIRRTKEHTRNYRRGKTFTLADGDSFQMDFTIPLSKYNTLRYEDSTKEKWQEENIGEFIRNDRFNCGKCKPRSVTIKIRKEYTIIL